MEKSHEPPPPYGVYGDHGQYPQAGYQPQMHYPPQGSYPGYQQSSMQTYNNIVVNHQPTVSTQQVVVTPYQDYMNAAILVTLCCFWPIGILAIIRASDARSAMSRGDMAAAASHSRSAKTMVNVSIVVGVISFVVAAIIIGVVVGISANSSPYKYIYSNNG